MLFRRRFADAAAAMFTLFVIIDAATRAILLLRADAERLFADYCCQLIAYRLRWLVVQHILRHAIFASPLMMLITPILLLMLPRRCRLRRTYELCHAGHADAALMIDA